MAQEVIKNIYQSNQVSNKNPQNVTKLSKITPRFNGTRFLRLEIYLKEMAKLQFLRIFEKATFFKAKRD